MACGPFETVGQGYAWSAAGLFVLALLMQLLIMVRSTFNSHRYCTGLAR